MSAKKIVLRFSAETTNQPVTYRLVKDYDLVLNILKANINQHKEGSMVLELVGEKIDEGVAYLLKLGIGVQSLTEEIIKNKDKCVSCGACTDICPSGALYIERPDMTVHFNSDRCIVCHLCVKACPVRAMEVYF